MVDLDKEEEEELLHEFIICRTLLEKAANPDPSSFALSLILIDGDRYRTIQDVSDAMAKFQLDIEETPRIQQALSEREWYVDWNRARPAVTSKKTLPELLVSKLTYAVEYISDLRFLVTDLLEIAMKKEVLLFLAGAVSGMSVILLALKPIFMIKVFAFVLCFCLFGGASFFLFMSLFDHFVTAEKDKNPRTRGQNIIFMCLILLSLAIGISTGIFMAGEVRQGSFNPFSEEEQIYR